MSKFAEKIKAHYASAEMGTVDVPEWGVVIHVRPATIGQSSAIIGEDDQFRQACKLIQVRSKDAEGKPMFDQSDFEAMVKYGDTSLINRIVGEIVDIGDVDEEDAKKP